VAAIARLNRMSTYHPRKQTGEDLLKKALAAALIMGVTLIIPGAAFAEKLPGGRPPCSIYRKAGGPSYDSFCNSFP
jgi:hypothetical protein